MNPSSEETNPKGGLGAEWDLLLLNLMIAHISSPIVKSHLWIPAGDAQSGRRCQEVSAPEF